MIHILSKENSIFNRFIAQIRDREVQRDSMRFRRNMERIGEVMSYEISRTLDYRTCVVETPLGEAAVEMISDKVVLATILRAGLPLHQGFLNYFDDAESAFVSAYRKSSKDGSLRLRWSIFPTATLQTRPLSWSILCWLRVRRSLWPTRLWWLRVVSRAIRISRRL